MKKLLVGFFLIISCLFIGFISGGTFAKYFLVKSGDGLAGGATVAMLGFLGAGIGLILSIVILGKRNEKSKLIAAIVLMMISLILGGFFQYQYKQRQKEKQEGNVGLFR
jgi:hypothetical protein